jgi:hypothetical protein
MIGLRGQREKVKQGVIVKKKISGIPRLWANDIGSLNGVATEKHRLFSGQSNYPSFGRGLAYPIEAHDIVVSFSGIKLDCKTARVACGVRKLSPKRDCWKAHENRRLYTFTVEEIGLCH